MMQWERTSAMRSSHWAWHLTEAINLDSPRIGRWRLNCSLLAMAFTDFKSMRRVHCEVRVVNTHRVEILVNERFRPRNDMDMIDWSRQNLGDQPIGLPGTDDLKSVSRALIAATPIVLSGRASEFWDVAGARIIDDAIAWKILDEFDNDTHRVAILVHSERFRLAALVVESFTSQVNAWYDM